MAKDPAFLFYSSDFLTGTLIMPFEDRGKYITILAYMHQNGRLNEETIRLLVGSVSDNLKSKFGIDNKGFWFNSRLEEEVIKRNNFTESRKENGKKGGRPPKKSTISLDEKNKPTHNLPEDENEIENIIEINEDLKEKKNELIKLLCEKFGWSEMRYSNKQRDVSAFVSVKILSEDDYQNFILQFNSYDQYKNLSEEKRHKPESLIGTQSERFEDSVLLSENWEARLNNFKLQNKSNKGTQSAKDTFEKLKM